MKKKVLVVLTATVLALSASAAISAVMSSWVKVSDPDCDKCIMNDTTRKCGKPNCGGFMESVSGTGKFESDGYLKYNYKCKKCGHTITYKNK
ncbi:MAG: hypothetical protein IJ200_03560 [Prevotella sp.]|nr:hypothetical protein [Prevotella sp.]